MPERRVRPPLGALAALALVIPLAWSDPGRAADLLVGPPEGGMAIDLHAARDEVGLRGRDDPAMPGMRLSRLGIAYAERFGDGLSVGLLGGYLSASQRGQALTGGMRFTGNYAGIGMRGLLAPADRIRVGLSAQFLYHWMDDSRDGQRIQLDWAQVDLAATLQVRLAGAVSVYAGPVYSAIRVEERARGTVDSTVEFEGRRDVGAIGGLFFEVEEQGRIGLEVRRGPMDGLAISFQRRF